VERCCAALLHSVDVYVALLQCYFELLMCSIDVQHCFAALLCSIAVTNYCEKLLCSFHVQHCTTTLLCNIAVQHCCSALPGQLYYAAIQWSIATNVEQVLRIPAAKIKSITGAHCQKESK